MNQSPLNGATLNGAPADSVQRVALSGVARAAGVAQYRILSRAAVASSPAASAAITSRILRPSPLQMSASASAQVESKRLVRSPRGAVGRASMLAGYTVFEREYFNSPVSTSAQAQLSVRSITIGRGVVGAQAQAQASATGFVVPRGTARAWMPATATAAVAADALVERRSPLAAEARAHAVAQESSPVKYSVPVDVTASVTASVVGTVVPREEFRDEVLSFPTAEATATGVVVRRGPLNAVASAAISAKESSPIKYRVPVAVTARASILADESTSLQVRVPADFRGVALVGVIASKKSIVTGPVSVIGLAQGVVFPKSYIALLFDENAPYERTVLLSPDSRDLTVV